ncbi:MAG: type II secretion system secretin GspD [bacterium]
MRMRIRPIVALIGVALAGMVLASAAWAQAPAAPEAPVPENPACTKPDPTRKYTFNFHKIEIEKLVQIINQITCRTILFEEKVRQKVSIFSQETVTADEAFELFQAALDAGGQYTLVPFDRPPYKYKIVLARDVKGMGIPTASGREEPAVESLIVTQMVRLKYVDAAELAQVLQQLISRDASIVPYPPTNTLIITDTGANIRRLLEMIAAVDVQESEQKIEVLSLQFAAAADIAEKVAQILASPEDTGATPGRTIRTNPTPRPPTPGGVPGGTPAEVEISPGKQAKILPYERTNSIIVVAGQAEIEKVRELVRQLDFDAPPGRAHFNVVHLKYARADEIVEVLAQLLGGGGGGSGLSSRSSSRNRNLSSSSSSSRFGTSSTLGGTSSNVAGLGSTLGSAAPLNRSDTGGGVTRAAAEAGEQFTGQVSVTADPATNSLLVSASPEDFRVLRPVIDELDVRRRQVFVEAAILEVVLDDSQTLGVQASSITGDGNMVGLVRSTLGDSGSAIGNVLADPITNFPAGFGAALTSTETVQIKDAQGNTVEVPAVAALIQALQANSNVNVLSTPHILTTDNEEAQIVVGQTVPFPTGTVFSNGGVNPVQTVERQDVGLTLRLTPQISEGGYVRLDIFQEVSAVVPTSNTQILTTLGPTTTKRSAETRVIVKDNQTVAIGGLIQDRTTTIESKIPYLGDIPYLGWLFSVNTDHVEKVNLMILLTPRVIRDDGDLSMITNNKRQDSNDFYKGSGQVNPAENYLDRAREQYPPRPDVPVAPTKTFTYTPPRAVDGRSTEGLESTTPSGPAAAPGGLIPTGRGGASAPAAGPTSQLAPAPSRLPAATATTAAATAAATAATVTPPAAAPPRTLEVVPEPEAPESTAARSATVSPERAGPVRAALGPVPPPGFESSPLTLSIQTAAGKSQRVVGLLVYVDGELIFSRHADTGLLDTPAPLTLFVNGVAGGDHEVKISLDLVDASRTAREVNAAFQVAVSAESRKLVRAKVLEPKGRAGSAPTILWTESEEEA